MADSTTTQTVVNLALLAPMLTQVGLMLLVGVWLAWARVGSVIRKKVDMRDVNKYGWKGWIKQAGNNYSNQFEAPVIFFVLCIFMTLVDLSTRVHSISPLFITLAWLFVVTRVVHAAIHLTFNRVPIRFLVFFLGMLCLMVMFVFTVLTVLNVEQYGIYRELGA